ncbi:kinesin-like protein KIN-7D, mitochondrial [Cynara cardunculus var. scolymus]|uniref:kinesin-like protein KIN-7D, mitochondrial n=1 Tax=Cynara cardunculus var. scolymus TaxID=59895 RepID=UPI000D63100F|nr:kinesin-like protein KIN-7D, mitochondrial [Cynara cardunculus var. scolymus]
MAASSSRGRSSSPFHHRKPSSPFSSSSSSSSYKQLIPRSGSSSGTTPFYGGSGKGHGSRSFTPSRTKSDSMYHRGGYGGRSPVIYPSTDEVIEEAVDSIPKSGGGDSISVTIRFRPLSEREYQRGDEIAWYADGGKLVRNEYNPVTSYAFDRVFGSSAATQEVYEVAARPVVKAAMEGVNGTVFAYGVTSSGKTHTMHGDCNSPGIIPLAIKDVFSIIQDMPGREFLLRVSYLEIYNEVINDLLDPTGQNLRVREDAQGTYVEGVKEEVVLSPGHALSFIASGEEHRHVGSNNFNLFSSRSHTIFTLMIESSAHGDEYDGVTFSQLNLIDLAGSESSKAETTGLRRKEGSYINKSLLTLGTVIGKLSEGKASHVPYRDSKLTRLLQSSLSGNGHVSLICTITPASSNMEETHNTLKFASRAKRVEIYASRNKIIDEKSLIKKYQREISVLKQELDQLKRGMLVNPEEIMTLKQKLEEGQVKMQSRLEEEEEAKAALMSRIQRLTKLILVSSKNKVAGLTDVSDHQRDLSANADDNGSLLLRSDNLVETPSEVSYELKHRRNSSNLSATGSTIMESTHAGEIVNGSSGGAKLLAGGISLDQMDLLVEQVKMLAGEIAFGTSTMKRLMEQSADNPQSSKTQIDNLQLEIEEKRRQMRVLEKQIIESNQASISSTSLVDMQQAMMRLMTQCDEKDFELEIKSADNRILQEQLQNKCSENKELQERITLLEQQLAAACSEKPLLSSKQQGSKEYIDELQMKIQIQVMENEKLKLEHVQVLEEKSGLCVQNQKLSEEASYAKELASAAAVELKNLAGEVTKLSLQNAKLEKELVAARELVNSGGNRKYGDRKGRHSDQVNGFNNVFHSEDLRRELQARKQQEASLEAALAEKEMIEDEYQKKFDEAKKRESALENDLANMWVLVAQLKKEAAGGRAVPETNIIGRRTTVNHTNSVLKERQVLSVPQIAHDMPKEDPHVARLKARMQEMKEKEVNGDANLHVCKVCFESPTAAMLLPCRHFSLCKSCSLACSECPICRTKIADRIFAFTS